MKEEKEPFMKIPIYLSAVLLLGVFLATVRAAPSTESTGVDSSPGSRRPELEYLKAVNTVAPPQDPQLLFLLMAEYASANMQGEGAEFFSARLNEFGPRLADSQKALYLSAIGLLRAQHASSVSLLHRIGYVKETIATLEQAKQLSGGQVFVVNWISGIVYAQLPSFIRRMQRRTSWPGAWRTPIRRRTQGGYEKFTTTLESWPSQMESKSKQ